MSGDTLLCTGEAQLFLSRRLDGNTVDIAFHGSGKILAHLHDMRRELGRLREHGCVDVADLPALFTDKRTDMAQQSQTVRTLVGRIGIRKMPADVSERERAEGKSVDAFEATESLREKYGL